jgi:transcriptional regulator with XRE-family HTH domain
MSQRQLARAAGIGRSTVASIECCAQNPRVGTLTAILRVGRCQLVIVDTNHDPAEPIWPWNSLGLRDRGWRLYPAHLDVREVGPSGEGWWGTYRVLDHGRERPTHTFDKDRDTRNARRQMYEDDY